MKQEPIINLDPVVGLDGNLDLGVGQQQSKIIFGSKHDWGITFEF
jgi:hypothetical protein